MTEWKITVKVPGKANIREDKAFMKAFEDFSSKVVESPNVKSLVAAAKKIEPELKMSRKLYTECERLLKSKDISAEDKKIVQELLKAAYKFGIQLREIQKLMA